MNNRAIGKANETFSTIPTAAIDYKSLVLAIPWYVIEVDSKIQRNIQKLLALGL